MAKLLCPSTTTWRVTSTITSRLASTTTSTSYHSTAVPPYAYYGLSEESFAGVLIVVLVLCGFYAIRSSRKQRGQAKLTQYVNKTTCIKALLVRASAFELRANHGHSEQPERTHSPNVTFQLTPGHMLGGCVTPPPPKRMHTPKGPRFLSARARSHTYLVGLPWPPVLRLSALRLLGFRDQR